MTPADSFLLVALVASLVVLLISLTAMLGQAYGPVVARRLQHCAPRVSAWGARVSALLFDVLLPMPVVVGAGAPMRADSFFEGSPFDPPAEPAHENPGTQIRDGGFGRHHDHARHRSPEANVLSGPGGEALHRRHAPARPQHSARAAASVRASRIAPNFELARSMYDGTLVAQWRGRQ